MRLTGLVLLVILAVAAAAAQAPETVAWRNGAWFDETVFRRVDVYSVGDRLTLKSPGKVDRTVDLTGRFLMGAFGEAHNHNIPSGDTARTYLEQGIFYAMIQTNALAIARAGLMTHAEVLQSAFGNHSRSEPPFGLAEGAPAYFIPVDGDPLDDLESITRVSLRVKDGRELHLSR